MRVDTPSNSVLGSDQLRGAPASTAARNSGSAGVTGEPATDQVFTSSLLALAQRVQPPSDLRLQAIADQVRSGQYQVDPAEVSKAIVRAYTR